MDGSLKAQGFRPTARTRPPGPILTEAVVAALGAGLVFASVVCDQAWFDRHFLPVLFLTRRTFVVREAAARIGFALAGLAAVFWLRPLAGRLAARTPPAAPLAATLRIAAALALALVVTEIALRTLVRGATEESPAKMEPLRRPDPRLGWAFVPSRTSRVMTQGRAIDYAFDAEGRRVRSLAEPLDPRKPTIVFAGESIVAGFGLAYDETVPAQVAALTGLQAANIAGFAWSDDQAEIRLADQLPTFARPKAVVVLFMPGLLYRDFNRDRPHLDETLAWRPRAAEPKLAVLARYLIPYHSSRSIERRLAFAHAVLKADVDMARARGATPLVIVPRFGLETAGEALIRRRVLDGLPALVIPVDPSLRLPDHVHPDPRGARVIAAAVAKALPVPLASP